MTRTDAIMRTIESLLNSRRAELDRATDIRGLILDLKFSPDCLEPRTVIDRIERAHERPKAPLRPLLDNRNRTGT